MDELNDKRYAAQGLIGLAGAVVSVWTPEFAPVIGAVAPSVGLAVDDMMTRRARRFSIAAENASGLDPAEVLERLVASDELLAVFARVVDASRYAVSDEKIAMLGRCFGKMAADKALVDPELIWVDVFEQIDRPHLKVISVLENERTHETHDVSMTASQLGAHSGLNASVQPILGTLERLGVLRSTQMRAHNGMPGLSRLATSSREVTYSAGPLYQSLLYRLNEARKLSQGKSTDLGSMSSDR